MSVSIESAGSTKGEVVSSTNIYHVISVEWPEGDFDNFTFRWREHAEEFANGGWVYSTDCYDGLRHPFDSSPAPPKGRSEAHYTFWMFPRADGLYASEWPRREDQRFWADMYGRWNINRDCCKSFWESSVGSATDAWLNPFDPVVDDDVEDRFHVIWRESVNPDGRLLRALIYPSLEAAERRLMRWDRPVESYGSFSDVEDEIEFRKEFVWIDAEGCEGKPISEVQRIIALVRDGERDDWHFVRG